MYPGETLGLPDRPQSVYATDLDGDADVLSASSFDNRVAWYENLGDGVFGEPQDVTTLAEGATSGFATDLDGDGDADVLSASTYNGPGWHPGVRGLRRRRGQRVRRGVGDRAGSGRVRQRLRRAGGLSQPTARNAVR